MQPCHAPRRDNDDSVQFAFDEIDELADGRDLVLKLEIDAQLLAERIDWLYAHRPQAAAMGRAGRARWETLGITWTRVIDRLLTA